MTGRGKHPDDDDALWQKVTSDVRAYDRAAELTSPAGPAVAKPEKKKKPKKTAAGSTDSPCWLGACDT
jgi:DNA-nicking Smr family endonuclease